MKWIIILFSYVLIPCINFLTFLMIDVNYDNMTYIGNTLHHPIYLLLWSSLTAVGLYFFSKKIWNIYKITYNKGLHFFFCFGWILSCSVPYGPNFPNWINNIHVWLAVLCTIGFSAEWILVWIKKERLIYPQIKSLLLWLQIDFSVCFFILCLASHVNALCEIVYSTFTNIILSSFLLKEKKGFTS